MKQFLLLFFLIALSCNQPKKEQKETKTIQKKETIIEDKVIKEEVKEKAKVIIQQEVIVVLKNPKDIIDAKAYIENSSLIWDHLAIDKNTLKAAIIKVPIDKKDFWIERLKFSNVFSSIEINSTDALTSIKNIAENTFVKISKTHCSGDCPVYDVTLFNDGKIIFKGIENVAILEEREFSISEEKMKAIKNKFEKTSFKDYSDSYVDKNFMDYPSTYITHNDKQIEIKLWKNVPDELAFAYEAIEDILFEQKLLE